ncbi:hypothetical protein GBA52_018212 [Prunus armeniaca]|nr:hypothetical protein GBA52_018212 [Prunus armeniaca]
MAVVVWLEKVVDLAGEKVAVRFRVLTRWKHFKRAPMRFNTRFTKYVKCRFEKFTNHRVTSTIYGPS